MSSCPRGFLFTEICQGILHNESVAASKHSQCNSFIIQNGQHYQVGVLCQLWNQMSQKLSRLLFCIRKYFLRSSSLRLHLSQFHVGNSPASVTFFNFVENFVFFQSRMARRYFLHLVQVSQAGNQQGTYNLLAECGRVF